VDSPLFLLLTGAGLLAAGLVMVMSLVTEAVVGAVAPERAGSASALMETCSEFGGALGIAVLGSIGTAAYRGDLDTHLPSGLPASIGSAAREGLPAANAVAAQLPSQLGDLLLAAARTSFSHSMNTVAVVGTLLLVATGITVTLVLRGTTPEPTPESTAESVQTEADPAEVSSSDQAVGERVGTAADEVVAGGNQEAALIG
jgi:DHA2 family multidrug resistance protein-like MFS transporter